MAGKSVLVVDTPTNCYECRLIYWGNIGGWRCKPTKEMLDDANGKPKWCPLRQLPSFKAVDLNDTRGVVMFCHGWNTCLAEITGETE